MTIKERIISYIKKRRAWVFGGTIEDYMRSLIGTKASCVSRRCRELVSERILERRLVKIKDVKQKVVQYRLPYKEIIVKPAKRLARELISAMDTECCDAKDKRLG